ncbi:hypothetical protein PENTCL1PPCAC_24631, partial [Pristionchus entomophagus]
SIFLSLEIQARIFLYFNVMCVVSTFLNILGLLCLIKKTPQNQATIRNYLILIQVGSHVLLMASDAHLEIGFNGIPLFPALAGYACGWMIQIGVSPHLELAITVVFYIWIGDATVMCILFRHQTLLVGGHKLKLREVESPRLLMSRKIIEYAKHQESLRIIQCLSVLILTSPVVLYAFNPNESVTVERYLDEVFSISVGISTHFDKHDPHNISWIRSRGSYYVEKRTTSI